MSWTHPLWLVFWSASILDSGLAAKWSVLCSSKPGYKHVIFGILCITPPLSLPIKLDLTAHPTKWACLAIMKYDCYL